VISQEDGLRKAVGALKMSGLTWCASTECLVSILYFFIPFGILGGRGGGYHEHYLRVFFIPLGILGGLGGCHEHYLSECS
jgi:hypothetical protein